MGKKLTVVWLCYFSNEEVQKHLKPLKPVKEYAPWIKNLIPLFENSDELDLHIIAPHRWLTRTKCFEDAGVKYYFIKTGIPFVGRHWPQFLRFDYWTDYFFLKRKVKNIVRDISPDLIHLHGAENEFSTTALQFNSKFPILVTLQGFLHKIAIEAQGTIVKRRINRELLIYKNFKHFAYRTETMKQVIQELNSKAKFHFHQYPYSIKPFIKPYAKKEYDVVFFARINPSKGILDLLKAVSLLNKKGKGLRILIIGNGNKKYLDELKRFCNKEGIDKNINWVGFLPTQNDVHKEASKAKISVLPTHYDMIPGTIIESMFLKIPVISYRTGSIPEINAQGYFIMLVEENDIDALAGAINELITNKEQRIEMAERGYFWAKKIFGEYEVKKDILTAYKTIISDFNS
jgi:glycosyltransferase involved in cell wall biosynthesis